MGDLERNGIILVASKTGYVSNYDKPSSVARATAERSRVAGEIVAEGQLLVSLTNGLPVHWSGSHSAYILGGGVAEGHRVDPITQSYRTVP